MNPSWSVEALLGFSDSASPLTLIASIEAGLHVTAIDRLAGRMAPQDESFKGRLIPMATLKRRRRSPDQRLTREESNRVARLAKAFSSAVVTFGSPERAREFLTQSHPMLEGRAPLAVALATSLGTDLVIDLLGCN